MTPSILLASASPRRRELLAQLGVDFEVCVPEVDETRLPDEPPVHFVQRLAQKKACAVSAQENQLVLAADTVVVLDEQILGKPSSAEEAEAMLASLSGKTHQVMTGVCLRGRGFEKLFCVTTEVVFRPLAPEEIRRYVQTGEPMDKAGAYAIQGGAAGMVREIHGSYTNVVGLPLCEVYSALSRAAIHPEE